jgi:dihydroxy-acid dehydratase
VSKAKSTGGDSIPAHDEGLRRRLTSYGDAEFSLFLRKAFIKGAGYTDDALDRAIVGIANTGSSYNPATATCPSSSRR